MAVDRRTQGGYIPRIADAELRELLGIFGAVLIDGPKWCGKTTTARQVAASEIDIDDPANDYAQRQLAQIDPARALEGPEPRLVDEWQEVPKLWDGVRYLCDRCPGKGHFILTGSATPHDEGLPHHSGAGRIARLGMSTMTLVEAGISRGTVSIDRLFGEERYEVGAGSLSLGDIASLVVSGGWPEAQGQSPQAASRYAREYLRAIAEHDMSAVDGSRRDPEKVMALLRSLSRNESTLASQRTVAADATGISQPVLREYLGILRRMHVVDDVPAWSPALRSPVAMRRRAKRHLADPSLAAAGMGATVDKLVSDVKTLGLLFESMVLRDLRVYGRACAADLYHFHDLSDLEVDAVLEREDGVWIAIEIKLGMSQVDGASENLLRLRKKLVDAGEREPAALCVIVGLAGITHVRADGVQVIAVDELAP